MRNLTSAKWAGLLLLPLVLSPTLFSRQVPEESPVKLSPSPPPAASAEFLALRGDTLVAIKDYARALEYYRAAVSKQPGDAQLRNRIAMSEMQLMHWQRSIHELEIAIRLNPQFADAYNNLGVDYYELKRLGKSIKYYNQALHLRQEASFYSNLGAAYFSKKDFEHAAFAYANALQLDPDVLDRTSRSGISALLPSPDDRARFDYVMAKLCAKAGASDRSLQHLRRALEEGYKHINDVFYTDEEFTQLRADPRFTELMNARPTALQNVKVR